MIFISKEDSEFGIGSNGINISFNYYDGIPDPSLLQTISDNNLMINLKQLFKKDDKTKEKALNNIALIFEEDPKNINDISILIWSMIYPKLLISNSKFIKHLANEITFTILNHIKTNKLKNLTSYYKDLLPLFVFSLQDVEKSVAFSSKKLLSQLFDNDATKIDNLYLTFKVNLIKIVYFLTFVETEETLYNFDLTKMDKDSLNSIKVRHSSLITSVLKLLSLVIHKNDQSFLMENEYMSAILNNEQIYSMISIKSVENNGKNGLVGLIELIFFINEKFEKDVNAKIRFWKLHKKAVRNLSKNLFKMLGKWKENRQQLLSPVTNNILLLLNSMFDITSFWNYDEDSYKVLFKWLLLGPGILTDSGYYSLLRVLNCNLASTEEPVFSLEKHWFKIWQKCLEKEFARKDRTNSRFFSEYWTQFSVLYHKFETSFDKDSILNMLLESFKNKKLQSSDLQLFRNIGLTNQLVKSLLLESLVKEDSEAEDICIFRNSIQFLGEEDLNAVANEKNKFSIKTSILFFSLLISCNKCCENTKKFIQTVEDDSLLISFINSDMFDVETDTINIVVPKIKKMLDNSPETISAITNSIKNIEILKLLIKALPQISEYMAVDSNSNIKSELIDLSMANKMFETKSIDSFIEVFNKFNLDLKVEFINSSEHFIYEYIFYFEHDSINWLESLEDVLKASNETVNTILSILQEQLSHLLLDNNADVNEKSITDFIIEPLKKINNYNHRGLIDFIFKSNILDLNKFLEAFTCLDLGLINVSGLKSTALLFFKDLQNSYFIQNYSRFKRTFTEAKFISYVLISLGDDEIFDKNTIAINLSILQKLSSHFSIITKTPNLELDLNSILHHIHEFDVMPDEIIDFVIKKNTVENSMLKLLEISNEDLFIVKFYKFEVLLLLLNHNINESSKVFLNEKSLSQLESDLLFIIRKESKDTNYNVNFINATLLLDSIYTTFEGNITFNKLSTYLMAEFHQLKPAEFETKNYKFLVILVNIFGSKNILDALNVNIMRFNTFIQNIKNLYEDLDWYEDELTYKQHFRLLFLQLFINLNNYETQITNSFEEFSENLLIDNLQICELILDAGGSFVELLSKCIALYNVFEFECNIVDAYESFLNIFLNQNSLEDIKFKDLLIHKIDSKFISNKFNLLIDTLYELEGKDLHWSNTCFLLILKVLISERKINSVDFELDRKQLLKTKSKDEVDETLSKTYYIDNRFIELINKLDYKEDGLIYLWTIEIVISFFKDTTVNLFNLYLQQLGKNWIIDNVFEKVIDDLSVIVDKGIASESFSFKREVSIRGILFEISEQLINKSNILIISNWYNNLKSGNDIISKYFTQQISPELIKKQISSIKTNSMFEDIMSKYSDFLSITVNEKFNIVKAKFDIDDQILDINYQFEQNFPLQPISAVLKSNKIGIDDKILKTWLLPLKKSSNILNNIMLICNNIKLKFSNLEECAICYYIINDTNKSLPNKKCPTCFKKFHNVCLFKWFKNSNSNTCPLCRSNFTF